MILGAWIDHFRCIHGRNVCPRRGITVSQLPERVQAPAFDGVRVEKDADVIPPHAYLQGGATRPEVDGVGTRRVDDHCIFTSQLSIP